MKTSTILILIGLLAFTACSDKLEEKIVSVYPTNTPSYVEYYRNADSTKILAKTIRFYFNGEKQEETYMNGDVKEGLRTLWYLNGNKQEESNYKNDIKHGAFTMWYENGELQYEAEYTDGRPTGTWRYYAIDGSLEKETKY